MIAIRLVEGKLWNLDVESPMVAYSPILEQCLVEFLHATFIERCSDGI